MRKILVPLILALALAAGCGASGADPTGPNNAAVAEAYRAGDIETAFLIYVRGETSSFENVDDAELVKTAGAVCKSLDEGEPGAVIMNAVLVGWGAEPDTQRADDLAVVVGGGVANYCPEHMDELD